MFFFELFVSTPEREKLEKFGKSATLPVTMETFAVDKAFYDIGSADDLKELWDDADLDPVSTLFI